MPSTSACGGSAVGVGVVSGVVKVAGGDKSKSTTAERSVVGSLTPASLVAGNPWQIVATFDTNAGTMTAWLWDALGNEYVSNEVATTAELGDTQNAGDSYALNGDTGLGVPNTIHRSGIGTNTNFTGTVAPSFFYKNQSAI